MANSKLVDLVFPVGGVDTRSSVQRQRPFTAPDALNVRPLDTIEGRERGGSRPGLVKAFNEQLGSGNPVRMLAQVSYVESNGYTKWEDEFAGTAVNSVWATAGWGSLTAPSLLTDMASVQYAATATGLVRSALTFDSSSAYEIGIYIVPYASAFWGKFQIFACMNATTPVATTDGTVLEIDLESNGAYSGTYTSYNATTGTQSALSTGTITPQPGWLRLLINGTTHTVTWQGTQLFSGTISLGASAGTRWGFGMNCTDAGGFCLVDLVRFSYKAAVAANDQVFKRIVVASANGSLYRESRPGVLEAVSTNLTLASDRQIQAVEWGQKLYIADNGNPKVARTTGATTSGVLDDANVTSWDALGIDTDDDVCVILSGTSATLGTFTIASVHDTNGVTLQTTNGVNPAATNGSAITYRIERCPKIYDPAANTLTKWVATDAASGAVPTGCQAITRFADSIVLASQPANPHVWYKSKAGDPLNWDYSSSSAGAAAAGNSANNSAGTIGEPIYALANSSDDYLLMCCATSILVLRGDPASGGTIDSVSKQVGIVDKSAWCYGPGGEFVFLSRDGLYVSAPGNLFPVNVSRDRIPQELLNLNRDIYTVTLKWDAADRGVHIFVTQATTAGSIHYWFDWDTKSFWPVKMPGTSEPVSALEYTAATDAAVLLGSKDGYVRKFYSNAETDNGTEIDSYVLYGPIRCGGSDWYEGIVNTINCALAQNSGDVTWSVLVGNTAEAAIDDTALETGTFVAGLNNTVRPRLRGHSFVLKMENQDTNRRWAVERCMAELVKRGRQRNP